MWRDIDSLRRQNALSRQQNEELRKENEANARETEQIEQEIEQIEQEIEQIEQEIEQIDRETEQIEQETAILRRQNKALAFLESRAFDKMIKELAGPEEGDARHPLDRVDVGLLCEKLVENGCDVRDLPFLLNALGLEGDSAITSSQESNDLLKISWPHTGEDVTRRDEAENCTSHPLPLFEYDSSLGDKPASVLIIASDPEARYSIIRMPHSRESPVIIYLDGESLEEELQDTSNTTNKSSAAASHDKDLPIPDM